jgi:uncharacterized membrane protein YoaK (UPF0700 family)
MLAYLLVRGAKPKWSRIKKHAMPLFVVVVLILIIELVGFGLKDGVDKFIDSLLFSLHLDMIRMVLPDLMKLLISLSILSMKVVILSFGFKKFQEVIKPTLPSEGILDDDF